MDEKEIQAMQQKVAEAIAEGMCSLTALTAVPMQLVGVIMPSQPCQCWQ